jgi:hypothetical protein
MNQSNAGMLAIGLVALVLSGCASVTITPSDEPKLTSAPTYERSLDFYFWGLSPDWQEVNVDDVCYGSSVRQMQAQTTFEDGLFGAITLGIFAPRTVKVWCEEEQG